MHVYCVQSFSVVNVARARLCAAGISALLFLLIRVSTSSRYPGAAGHTHTARKTCRESPPTRERAPFPSTNTHTHNTHARAYPAPMHHDLQHRVPHLDTSGAHKSTSHATLLPARIRPAAR